MFTLTHLFNIILDVSIIATRQEKEIKYIQTGWEKIYNSLFTSDKIIYVENSKE